MLLGARALAPAAGDPLEEIQSIVARHGSRIPGSPGNRALAEFVRQRFESSGFTNGAIRFTAPVFTPGRTVLAPEGQPPIAVEPLHPTLMRPGNFTETNFASRLVYLGRATHEDLLAADGKPLAGSIGVVEFACGSDWQGLLRFGLRGFVFLGDGEASHTDSLGKIYSTEVAVPRFYAAGEDAGRLRRLCADGATPAVRVEAQPSDWREEALEDYWVLVPGTAAKLGHDVVLLSAALDSNAVVPGRAEGAQGAGNLALLLAMLDELKARPAPRPVLLVAVNARSANYLGDRMLCWHAMSESDGVENLRGRLAREMRVARLFSSMYSALRFEDVSMPAEDLAAWVQILTHLCKAGAAAAPAGAAQTAAREAAPELDLAAIESLSEAEMEARSRPAAPRPPDLSRYSEKEVRAAIDSLAGSLAEELKGVRYGLSAAAEIRRKREKELAHVRAQRDLPWAQMQAKIDAARPTFQDEQLLESWRTTLDGSSGVRLPLKRLLQEEAQRNLNVLKSRIMGITQDTNRPMAEKQVLLDELHRERRDLTTVLVLFNKIEFGIERSRVHYRDIATNPAQLALLRGDRDSLMQRLGKRYEDARRKLLDDSSNDGLRLALGTNRLALALSLEADWRGEKVGFCSWNPAQNPNFPWQKEFGELAADVARSVSNSPPGRPHPFVDSLTREGNRLDTYYFEDPTSAILYYHACDQLPAFALKSVFLDRGRAFTPDDTFANLDLARARGLREWLVPYLSALLSDPRTTQPDVKAPGPAMWSTIILTYTLDAFTGKTTPDREVPGSFVTLYPADKTAQPLLRGGEVVNVYESISDSSGYAVMYGLIEDKTLASVAYRLDAARASADYAIDQGQVQESKQMTSDVYEQISRTLPMFECWELPVYDRVDPTLVSDVPVLVQGYWPLTARGKAQPQKFGLLGARSVASQFGPLAPITRGPVSVCIWRKRAEFAPERALILTQDKRAALNAGPEAPEGRGFESAAELGSDFFGHVSADMRELVRLRQKAMKGVSNELLDDYLRETDDSLQRMDRSLQRREHAQYVEANYSAVGNAVKAYEQVRSMNRDMLKAVVVYMALMVPFCLFLCKLLFHFTKLEQEALAFTLLFTATYALFRNIHPAFRIALNPEAIFIAFVLGAIGLFVMWVLRARFETEMHLLFHMPGGRSDVTYSTVSQTAMLIGVNNMKRRRIRTTLTTGTIMLVVFTMLAFSSVSRRVAPTLIRTAQASPYTGFMYHWPEGQEMDEDTPRVIQNLFGRRAQVIARRLWYPLSPFRVTRTDGGRGEADLEALMGLAMDEDAFLGRLPLVHGRYFSSPDAREMILPSRAADVLGIRAADVGRARISLGGTEWTVVGIVDDERLRLLRDLDPDFPILPLKRSTIPGQTVSHKDASVQDLSTLVLDTAVLALVSERQAAELGGKPVSVSVRLLQKEGSVSALWDEARLLLGVTRAKFHLGSTQPFRMSAESKRSVRPGIYYVGSGYRTSIGGLARLLIPLLIAGSIILNTMLGSVYERKSEIAIYNAVGLSPTHILLFFLAEAFVYGVIGSVGGYLLGQILAIGMKALDLVKGVNINFSSLMACYAILFTMALVLLSTLYPAVVATRTAVPSRRRRWSLPDHDGQRLQVSLPFIYRPHLACGAMSYLHEFFSAFTEQSIGEMIATLREAQQENDSAGRPVWSLSYALALAPFDLGVTQNVRFTARYDESVRSYRIDLTAERVSGQDQHWVTTNRPFLEKLRRLLMRWRNLDAGRHEWYVAQAEQLFRDRRGSTGGNA